MKFARRKLREPRIDEHGVTAKRLNHFLMAWLQRLGQVNTQTLG